MEIRRLQRDLIAAFQYFKGAYEKDNFFIRACSDSTEGHGFELKGCRYIIDIRRKDFRMRIVCHFNRFPREVLNASSLQVLKAGLKVLSAT